MNILLASDLHANSKSKTSPNRQMLIHLFKTFTSLCLVGMSGLTNSILTMKSQIKSVENVDSKIKELSRNMTEANKDIISTQESLTKLSPEVSLIATDISALRSGITRMSRSLQVDTNSNFDSSQF